MQDREKNPGGAVVNGETPAGQRALEPGGVFMRRVFVVALVVVALLALWYLRDLVLLIFGAVLVAIGLRALAAAISAHTRLGEVSSFVVAALALLLTAGGFFYVLGAQLQAQLAQLWERLPELLAPLETWLGVDDAGEWLGERAEAMLSQVSVVNQIAGLSSIAASLVANLVLVVVAGFYLGFRPGLYLHGFLLLFPPAARDRAADTLGAIHAALQRWLVGQMISMLVVGTLVFLGLWALGIESALALAFIAGVLEFIPFAGPLLAAAPAIAIALGEDPVLALWVAALYLVVQQIEGNLLNPLIQQRAVALAPAVSLFALLAFGILFGPLGVLLAIPLAVVCLVTVKRLWVEDAPGDE